jgi:hypothetical protein
MTAPAPDVGIDHIGAMLKVRCSRPERRITLVQVDAPGYQEFFFVLTSRETVTITAFDASDESWEEPRIYHLPRPHGWQEDASDEEFALALWRLTGYPR